MRAPSLFFSSLFAIHLSSILVILIHHPAVFSVDAFAIRTRIPRASTLAVYVSKSKQFKSSKSTPSSAHTSTSTQLSLMIPSPSDCDSLSTVSESSSLFLALSSFQSTSREQAEQLAGPFFGASLFPYLAFLYFLNVPENKTPKGVTVGFATCLLFVFLTIPAAIGAQVLYGVSLADSDWLHGSAESLLTVTNLVTVLAFRQAFRGKEEEEFLLVQGQGEPPSSSSSYTPPLSVTSYTPMTVLVIVLTVLAGITALIPAIHDPQVHTPYLNGFLDIPHDVLSSLSTTTTTNPLLHEEPSNALTVGCWIIHVSSLVEFLVAMGFAWRWADIVQNPKWKGLTWGLIPLHSSGITACTYHLFYNSIPVLVPLQAFLTCVGNTTAAYAAYRIAVSNGWKMEEDNTPLYNQFKFLVKEKEQGGGVAAADDESENNVVSKKGESSSLLGFEDLGDALANDSDYIFLVKLFAGCALVSYAIKYGELLFDFPFEANLGLGVSVILIPSFLNAFKWYKRSLDPTFEGWF